jgi:hypothetical protein
MLSESRLIVERCRIAGEFSRTKKSGFKGDCAAASMTSRGFRKFSLEDIKIFRSLNLKGVFSPATNAILGVLGNGEEMGSSLPV